MPRPRRSPAEEKKRIARLAWRAFRDGLTSPNEAVRLAAAVKMLEWADELAARNEDADAPDPVELERKRDADVAALMGARLRVAPALPSKVTASWKDEEEGDE